MTCPEEKDEAAKNHHMTGRLLKVRTILIGGTIDEELGEHVISQLLVLDAESQEPIRVFVTTPGGMTDVGFAIHDMMRFVRAEVIAIGAGLVASMGVPIMLAARKENRFALPNTRFMIHQPSGGAGGQASDIRITAQEIIRIRERINRLVAEETGQPFEKIVADSDRDFWLDAQQGLEYGLVSRVISNAGEIG